jgi:hypothetical protein
MILWARAIDRKRSARSLPQRGTPTLLCRDRAASTLLAIEIEMLAVLRLAARGRMASLS